MAQRKTMTMRMVAGNSGTMSHSKLFELSIVSKTPHIKPGWVEIRLMSLMDALSNIK